MKSTCPPFLQAAERVSLAVGDLCGAPGPVEDDQLNYQW